MCEGVWCGRCVCEGVWKVCMSVCVVWLVCVWKVCVGWAASLSFDWHECLLQVEESDRVLSD